VKLVKVNIDGTGARGPTGSVDPDDDPLQGRGAGPQPRRRASEGRISSGSSASWSSRKSSQAARADPGGYCSMVSRKLKKAACLLSRSSICATPAPRPISSRDDLSVDWVEDWAGAGVAQIEDLLSKHAAFLSFLDTIEQ